MTLAFGEHRLDITRRELRRGRELIALEPKAFDLLAFLVQHRDRVVSKGDLLEAIWGGRIVSDSALTTRINAVRRALGDDGAAQRLIRTFIRKGIRFVAEVTEVSDHAVTSVVDEALDRGDTPVDKPSIAVLPFQNLTGDPEQDYFADGMTDELIIAIARFPWLSVIARNSSFTYKGKAVDAIKVARQLGVRYVLEGSVRKAGNRVRVTGELIDTTTALHIWGERFDGNLEDIFDLQDRIASSVAGAIEPKLLLSEMERAHHKPTKSLDAYDFYLRAQAQAYKLTREGMAESIRLSGQALRLDPGYGMAMARIALSRAMQMLRRWIPNTGPEVDEGILMARRALAAAGNDPWALDWAGLTLSILAGDNDAALSAIDRALVLNPNCAETYGDRALILVFLNRPEEAILSAQRAIRLSPFHPATFAFCTALALAYLAAGRYEHGLRWAEAALRENSGIIALRIKLSLCGHLGRHDEAEESLRRLREIHPEPTLAGFALPKGLAAPVAERLQEGLRKAGVPET